MGSMVAGAVGVRKGLVPARRPAGVPLHDAAYERTGTPSNRPEYPADVALLVVRWRPQYALSPRDLATMSLERGIVSTHEAAREWEAGDPRAGVASSRGPSGW